MEMNIGFVDKLAGNQGWNGNLDALNDYLRWPQNKYKFVFKSAERIRNALSYPETIRWLTNNLAICHPENRTSVHAKIAMAEKNQGQTLFDVILEILQDHKDSIELVLR